MRQCPTWEDGSWCSASTLSALTRWKVQLSLRAVGPRQALLIAGGGVKGVILVPPQYASQEVGTWVRNGSDSSKTLQE